MLLVTIVSVVRVKSIVLGGICEFLRVSGILSLFMEKALLFHSLVSE